MQTLTSLLLLTSMVVLAKTEKTIGEKSFSIKNLFSDEAKVTMRALQQYMTDVDSKFDEFGNQLKSDNNVLEALQEYKGVYESAKKTSCKGDALSINDDEDLLASFIDECTDSLSVEKLAAYSRKVKVSKAKVKALDDTLRENDKTCATDPTGCAEKKKTVLEDLDSVLSAEEKASFEKDAQDVLNHAKSHVEECFTEEATDLLNEVEKATNAINECLSKKS